MKKIFKTIIVILLLFAVVVTAGYFSKKYNVFEKKKENNISDSTEKKDDDSVSEKISFSFDLNKLNSTYFEEEKMTVYSNTNDHKKSLEILSEENIDYSDPTLKNFDVAVTCNLQDEGSQNEAYVYMFAKTVSLKIDSDKIDELDSIKEIKMVIDDVTYEIKSTDTRNVSINEIPCSVSLEIAPLETEGLFLIRIIIIPGCGIGVAEDTQFVVSTLNFTSFATENVEVNF